MWRASFAYLTKNLPSFQPKTAECGFYFKNICIFTYKFFAFCCYPMGVITEAVYLKAGGIPTAGFLASWSKTTAHISHEAS